jgi:hypothetical protein
MGLVRKLSRYRRGVSLFMRVEIHLSSLQSKQIYPIRDRISSVGLAIQLPSGAKWKPAFGNLVNEQSDFLLEPTSVNPKDRSQILLFLKYLRTVED